MVKHNVKYGFTSCGILEIYLETWHAVKKRKGTPLSAAYPAYSVLNVFLRYFYLKVRKVFLSHFRTHPEGN